MQQGSGLMAARNPAYRRYLKRMAVAAVLYVAAILVAFKVLHHNTAVSPPTVALALLPGLAALLMLYAIGRLLTELEDEYLRMLEVRKALIATAVALAVASVWGLLEMLTAVPKLEVFWIFPIWCLGLLVGAVVNRVTMGSAGLM
jgi:hypothetical protein